MREVSRDPEARANFLEACRKDWQPFIRAYEAGFGRPFQAVGLTVDDKRESYDIRLDDGTRIDSPLTTSTTLPAGHSN